MIVNARIPIWARLDELRELTVIEPRRREPVMAARGKLGMWLELIAPGWIDRIAAQAIERGQ